MKVEVTRTLKRVVRLRVVDGILKVEANLFLSEKKIRDIINKNIDWINSQKSTAATVAPTCVEACEKPDTPPKAQRGVECSGKIISELADGKKTMVMGDIVTVKASECSKSYIDANVLYISEKFFCNREMRLKATKQFLKKLASTYVSTEIADFGSAVSLCPTKIEFRDNQDFWVKCSLAGRRTLCFDFRIVQLPQRLRQYVIAHGFAHFAHPLHDEDFWVYLSRIFPQYRECAHELENFRILKEI